MTPSLAAFTLAHLIWILVVGWFVGDWLLDVTARRRERGATPPEGAAAVEWPERLLMSVVGFVVFALGAMVANIVLGGAVFGSGGVVIVLALVAVALRWRRAARPQGIPWLRIGLFVVVVVVGWSLPTLLEGTAARSGDIPWHLGWTEQLLAGEPVPEGPAPSEVAGNAYPWGFHALLAALVRLVPGSEVSTALIALQLVLAAAIPLGAACLARRVLPAAGWAAGLAGATFGGFGWVLARGAAFFTSPSRARYGADLVVASPNAVYELFPPPLPREIGVVLLAAVGTLLAIGLARDCNPLLVLSGVVLGCAGLVSVPALLAGVTWALAAVVISRRGARLHSIALIGGPALVVFALWAGPVIRRMAIEGGLVNVSPVLGREWPLWTAFGSWGLLLPLALAGGVVAYRRGRGAIVGSFAAATSVVLAVAIARGAFDWTLAGNATALHQGRIWPVARLLAGAAAGVALWAAWAWLSAHRRALAHVALGAVFTVGALSPAMASVSLADTIAQREGGFDYRRSDLEAGSFVRQVAARLGPDDTVVVRGPSPQRNKLAFYLFSFSGVRLADYDDPRLESNDLRIRYRDLAAAWDARAHGSGFPVDYEVVLASEAVGEGILNGEFGKRMWVFVAADSAGDAR